MPQLLLELFSEEIPARMQAQAARDLARMAQERLKAAGLPYEDLQTHAGPRRLTLVVEGLPAAQDDRHEEIKGPRANAPAQALDGFLRKTGLSRADLTERDGVLYAAIAQKGRPTPQIVAEMAEAILRGFPWPKSMRWGAGSFRWVRPLKRILCLFDGVIVPFAVEGIESGDLTEGHRFMGENHAPFAVRDRGDYRDKLAAHFVVLEQAERKRLILDGARAVCAAEGLALVEDEGLLEEVSGLAEWPVPVLGDMDPAFLDLPPEVIRTSMRTHQKYFAVRPAKGDATDKGETTGDKPSTLAPHFVVVANIAAPDGGATLAAGNAKVLSARLSDARFFWTEDRKTPLMDRLETLKGVTFHAKLGTMFERVERIEALAREIAPLVGADPALAAKAARLCKADLATGMVGEFPELQGVMGGYYARAEGLEPEVCDAIRDHYKPVGPSDSVPTAPVTVAVALADKLDTLVGFFAIDEKPTGSRDPFALRRAALGVIRLILTNQVRLQISGEVDAHSLVSRLLAEPELKISPIYIDPWLQSRDVPSFLKPFEKRIDWEGDYDPNAVSDADYGLMVEVSSFVIERLKVMLREQDIRHDLIDASCFGGSDNDLVRIVRRVEALSDFLATEDGATLLAGYKRAVNILKAEAKKGEDHDLGFNPELSANAPAEEAALVAALRTEAGRVDEALSAEDFTAAMGHLAHLRSPVDAFFDQVLVNDPDPAVRLNRLRLLTQVRDTANRVADFSLISG